jgi:hypothetical protein
MSARHVVKKSGTETLLYDPAKDELHVLNATAELILRLSREGKGAAEIEEAIRARCRVPPERDIRAEIAACLEALREKGI